jgi:hypothetical protein
MWCLKALLATEAQAGAAMGVKGHSMPWDILDARRTLLNHQASDDGEWMSTIRTIVLC